MKNKNIKQGKRNKINGAIFEKKVRVDLESKGWIVDKWSNNIDLENNKIVPAKHQYNPFRKSYSLGSGFTDFIAFRYEIEKIPGVERFKIIGTEVIGIEVKTNGYLKPIEKQKCKWYIDNNIFSKILIARKTKQGRKIVIKYEDFEEKYLSL